MEIVLFLSAAAATQVVVQGVDRLFSRVRTTRSERESESWREPLTREAAIESAKWFVISGYAPAAETLDPTPGPDDHLEGVSDYHDVEAKRWTVAFRDAAGTIYRVTLSDLAGIPSPSMIERITKASSD